MGRRTVGKLRHTAARGKLPWLPLLLLALTAYLFWVLPLQLPDRPVEVVFEAEKPQEQTKSPADGSGPQQRTDNR